MEKYIKTKYGSKNIFTFDGKEFVFYGKLNASFKNKKRVYETYTDSESYEVVIWERKLHPSIKLIKENNKYYVIRTRKVSYEKIYLVLLPLLLLLTYCFLKIEFIIPICSLGAAVCYYYNGKNLIYNDDYGRVY